MTTDAQLAAALEVTDAIDCDDCGAPWSDHSVPDVVDPTGCPGRFVVTGAELLAIAAVSAVYGLEP